MPKLMIFVEVFNEFVPKLMKFLEICAEVLVPKFLCRSLSTRLLHDDQSVIAYLGKSLSFPGSDRLRQGIGRIHRPCNMENLITSSLQKVNNFPRYANTERTLKRIERTRSSKKVKSLLYGFKCTT